MTIEETVARERAFFRTGKTLPYAYRRDALARLRLSILAHEEDINAALRADLNKSPSESYMCEIGMTLSELSHIQKHLSHWLKKRRAPTPPAQFHAKSFTVADPYGVVLIMSPWNYPFMLTMDPLIGAIAAGNCCVVKPSAYSPAVSAVIRTIVSECFPPEYVTVVEGGRAENKALLDQVFDYIFFTGSQAVGKEVMKKASEYLTPVTLELGGKSPCIVDKTANLRLAAKRIVFGKFLNCGQTCVAPDYIYCDPEIKDALVAELRRQISRQYGKEPLKNRDYGKIINEKHFDRINGLIDPAKTVCGGGSSRETLQIEPTILDNVTFDDPVMQQEIFGPVLPVLTYDSLGGAVTKINSMAHPLALYIFTEDEKNAREVTSRCGFGGGCINDTIIHLATSAMPFGGVGESGMGGYHGQAGFDEFTHYRSIVDKKTWMDLPVRYQRYNKFKRKMLRMFLK